MLIAVELSFRLQVGERFPIEEYLNRFPEDRAFTNAVFLSAIAPELKKGKRVIIGAHGNSLRALVKHLEGISDDAIVDLNIPTAAPLLYELDDDLKPIAPGRYLGDPEEAKKRAAAVASELKKK